MDIKSSLLLGHLFHFRKLVLQKRKLVFSEHTFAPSSGRLLIGAEFSVWPVSDPSARLDLFHCSPNPPRPPRLMSWPNSLSLSATHNDHRRDDQTSVAGV